MNENTDKITISIDKNFNTIIDKIGYDRWFDCIFSDIYVMGLSDRSKIESIEIIKQDDYSILLEISHNLVRGIGYTEKNKAIIYNKLLTIPEFAIAIKNQKGGTMKEKEDTKEQHPLELLQDRIDNAIKARDNYQANELLDLYARYKLIILDI